MLVDCYDVIIDIWNYLIQATEKDILALPELERGDKVPSFLTKTEQSLVGFMVNRGSPYPKNIYTTWAARDKEITRHKNRIIKLLPKIRHWRTQLGSYKDVENQQATYYVDPPYFNAGKFYVHNSVDYEDLSNWCRTRQGQVIVCENEGAEWLDFKPLCATHGQKKNTKEMIWTN